MDCLDRNGVPRKYYPDTVGGWFYMDGNGNPVTDNPPMDAKSSPTTQKESSMPSDGRNVQLNTQPEHHLHPSYFDTTIDNADGMNIDFEGLEEFVNLDGDTNMSEAGNTSLFTIASHD